MDAFPRVFRSSDLLLIAARGAGARPVRRGMPRQRVLHALLWLAAAGALAPPDAQAAPGLALAAATREDARRAADCPRSAAVAPQPREHPALELSSFDIAHARDSELAAYAASHPPESCSEASRYILLCHPAHAGPHPLPHAHPQLPPEVDPLHPRSMARVRSRSPPAHLRRLSARGSGNNGARRRSPPALHNRPSSTSSQQ